MNTSAQDALRIETEFLAGAEANFENAKGRHFRGTIWQTVRDDDSGALRAAMARHRNYDREQLKHLPQNRRVTLHGYERRWIFGKRRTGMASATVLTPLDHFARPGGGGDVPPVTLGELVEHVRRVAGDGSTPHVIGVCSPTGFTEEARKARVEMPNVSLVLVEPSGSCGWKVTGATEGLPDYVLRIFDPEGTSRKLERVKQEIAGRSADLLTGGLSVSSMAGRLGLSEPLVTEAFAQAAKADPELRLSKQAGEVLLFRGASAYKEERSGMDVLERIKSLFSREGNEAQKINALAERRAALAQRRDRIYEDIGQLEKKEATLLDEGKKSSSQIARRRMAAQLAQLRKDIARQNTTANMLNQQINIISTDIHNLTLIQQGEVAQLPTTEELTENAVKAEEMLETLKADADLVGNLATGLDTTLTSADELAILKEFEEADQAKAAAPSKAKVSESVASADEFEEAPARKGRQQASE